MEKLNICHVSLALYPDHRDGSAKFARGLYDELKSRGHNVTVLTAKWDRGFPEDSSIITVNVPQSRFLWVPPFYKTFKKYLKTHEFDIIHGNGSRGSLPIIFSGKNYITTIHDLGPFESRFSIIPGLRWLEKKNARKAKKIITCSKIIHQGIHQYMGADLNKMSCVYSAIDERYKPDPKGAERIKEELGLEGPILFYVGRIAFYKGVDHIIEAYKKAKKEIPDLNLVIGGKPTLKMRDTVEKWKRIHKDVKFVGMIPDELMPAYYTMADVFVTYSFASEGFGLTPVEAIACGTPVIASSLPAYQEVLENHATFVEPKRPDLLTEAILEFFSHPEKNRKDLKAAQEFIKRYTWKAVGDRVEKVYQEFLTEYGPSG